jgi:hypothetical protein
MPRESVVMKWILYILSLFMLVLGSLNFHHKQGHYIIRFFAYACSNTISFGEIIKSFEHFNALLNSCHLLEAVIDDVHACFEAVILFVPSGGFDVQDFVLVTRAEFIEELPEGGLDF